jgi:cysteine-dependent adenosine diphosphate thiazole synthase
MAARYFQDLHDYADTDVVIVGAGSAGLSCAYELSKIAPDVKVKLDIFRILVESLAADI